MLARIALRNVFRNRRRSAITMVVLVVGATALILFGGYKEISFYGLRESTIRNRVGHLQIYKKGFLNSESQKPLEFGLENVAGLRRAIENDARVEMTVPQISLMGLVTNGEKSETFLATGVEADKDQKMSAQRLVAGESISDKETDGVIVGELLARSMNVKPGDFLTLMTTTVSGSLNGLDVRVRGTFATGMKEFDERAIKMPLAGAQQLLQTQKIERLLVLLKKTDETDGVKTTLESQFVQNHWDLEIRDWSVLATYYHQVRNIFNGIFGFLGIIVFLIVIVSVANTIILSIFERTREIGTLMAMGTRRRQIWAMFFLEGLMIGVAGGFLGIAVGSAAGELINQAHIQLPPPPGYTTGYNLRIMLKPSILITVMVLSSITATLASVLPALKASRLKIVDALGHI
ncbi:MAG TPA: FtsX-like permease family protein [Terriglobia bacterium]|nr:FtsX-like permease family protein [Terriglobia bacterium]